MRAAPAPQGMLPGDLGPYPEEPGEMSSECLLLHVSDPNRVWPRAAGQGQEVKKREKCDVVRRAVVQLTSSCADKHDLFTIWFLRMWQHLEDVLNVL